MIRSGYIIWRTLRRFVPPAAEVRDDAGWFLSC
jgi:hypothetical protein